MKKALIDHPTTFVPGPIDPSNLSKTASNPDNAEGPGTAKLHTTIAESPSPSPGFGDSAPSSECHCKTVVATSAGYVDADGEEHDAEYYYRHCELHDPGKKDYWSIASLGDLMKLTDTTFTKEGRAFWKELRRESDERNPYIAEMERVKAEIQKVDDELNFMGVAKEKIKDWNQESQGALARTGKGIPFPAWLERYRDLEKFYETKKQLGQKRQALMDKKFELHIEIVNYRYQINQKEVLP